jgi:plasmid stabilization system protein ParE
MAIDLNSEEIIKLSNAPKFIPGRPHIATIYRWIARPDGALETIKVGGRIFTSVEAIQRFADRCTHPTPTQTRTPKQRQRDIDRAEAELAAAGI